MMKQAIQGGWTILAVLAVCVAGMPQASAGEVSGTIDTDTAWDLAGSPYTITGNLMVASGATLTIDSGVTVVLNAGRIWTVNGAVVCGAATIQFSYESDIVVNGVLEAAGAVVLGHVQSKNYESLTIGASGQATLTDCDISALSVYVNSSDVVITGGSIGNVNRKPFEKGLNLGLSSGASPIIAGVDFSSERDWLYISWPAWFQAEALDTMATNITGNVYAANTIVTLGLALLTSDFSFPVSLPYGANTSYVWYGGEVSSGARLTVPAGTSATVTNGLVASGPVEVGTAGSLEVSGVTALAGGLTVSSEGSFANVGALSRLSLESPAEIGTGATVLLDGTVTISDSVTFASDCLVEMTQAAVQGPGSVMTVGTGTTVRSKYPGLEVKDGAEVASTGAMFNLTQFGDIVVQSGSTFLAQGTTFSAGAMCDIQVNGGVFNGTGCTFQNDSGDPVTQRLVYSPEASGALTTCAFSNWNVELNTGDVSITGGSFVKPLGPALVLGVSSGNGPIIQTVNFSQAPVWLSFTDMEWLAAEYGDSLLTRIKNNTIHPQATVEFAGRLESSLSLNGAGTFGGAGTSLWRWVSGSTAPLSLLTVASGNSLTVSGNTLVEGALMLEDGSVTSLTGKVEVGGSLALEDGGTLAFSDLHILPGGSMTALGSPAKSIVSMSMPNGSRFTSEGTFAGESVHLNAGEDCVVTASGAFTLDGCTFSVSKGTDLLVNGDFNATDTVFNGHAFTQNLEDMVFGEDSESRFLGCEIHDFNLRISGDVRIQYSLIENSNGPGLAVLGGPNVELSHCNLLYFSGDGVHNAAPITVGAENCWWGASDGPSGAGSGTGVSISWSENSGGIDYEPFEREAINLGPIRIVSHEPNSAAPRPVNYVDVTFNGVVDGATFTSADVVMTGPLGLVGVHEPGLLEGNTWRIPFPPQLVLGTYHVLIGPNIRSVAGRGMDQDNDDRVGEPVDDVYDASFSLGDMPEVNFGASPTQGCVPENVVFTDLSTNGPTSWAWDFGDGATSNAQHPTHLYMTAGVYTVSLTATNSFGSVMATKTDYIVLGGVPTADFAADGVRGVAPLTVAFTDLSMQEGTTWAWDFGDGGASDVQHPTHEYQAPGVYTVSLVVGNQCGSDEEVKVGYITVGALPDVPQGLNATDGTGCGRVTVTWQNVSGAVTYDLYRDHTVLSTGLTAVSHQDNTVAAGVTYSYEVVAVNSFGSSAPSVPDMGYAVGPLEEGPGALTASDGAFTDRVRIEWEAVDGATGYRLRRSTLDDYSTALDMGVEVTGLSYDDTTAARPTQSTTGGGCGGASTTTTYHYYFYWAVPVNPCGVGSTPSASDRGHVGLAGAKRDGTAYEPAIPSAAEGAGGVRVALPGSPVAVRLRSDGPIDGATVWGQVRSAFGVESDVVVWTPVAPEGVDIVPDNDGWVVYEPSAPWLPGDTITLTAGALTVDGAVVESVSYEFVVAPEGVGVDGTVIPPVYEGSEAELRAQVSVTEVMDAPEGMVGPAYRVGGHGVYETAHMAWLPVPAGAAVEDLGVYYYLADGSGSGWYPAERVEGWQGEGGLVSVTVDGVTWLGVPVRHSADTVCLVERPAELVSEAASVVPFRFSLGDGLLMASMAGLIVLLSRLGKRARA